MLLLVFTVGDARTLSAITPAANRELSKFDVKSEPSDGG